MKISEILKLQQEHKNKSIDVKHIRNQLINLQSAILSNENKIYEALKIDLNKNKQETLLTEISSVSNEIKWFIKNIEDIHKMKKNSDFKDKIVAKSYVQRKCYGNTLIYSPYNYPFQLSMIPIVGAIACNNTVVLKPSEHTPKTNEIIAKILSQVFESSQAYVIPHQDLISPDLYKELYASKFDLVFFTGGTEAGKKVYENYAKQLIPVTLELGGKSPVIIDKNIDMKKTISRLVWSKLLNSGQTCVAPDYLIINKTIEKQFTKELIKYIESLEQSKLISDLVYVSNKNIQRLTNLVKDDQVIYCREISSKHCPIMLTKPISMNSLSMKEEIFGPIFPIVTYDSDFEIVEIINRNPNPLAAYVFSDDKGFINKLHTNITCGAMMSNNCVLHVNLNIPFGGVCESGIGRYHKQASVETFTRFQPLVYATNFNSNFTHMPYSEIKFNKIKKLFKKGLI
ncbi:MAG: aldehyde dehydrogenase family protein [Mycoplasma sp.]